MTVLKTYSFDIVFAEDLFSMFPSAAYECFIVRNVEFVGFLEIDHHIVDLQLFEIDIFLFQWPQKQVRFVLKTFIVEWSEFLVMSSIFFQSSSRRKKHDIMKYIEINIVCFAPFLYVFIAFLKKYSPDRTDAVTGTPNESYALPLRKENNRYWHRRH